MKKSCTRRQTIRALASFGVLLLAGALQAGSVSLNKNEVLQLRALIAKDTGAAKQFKPIREMADRALLEQPNPIAHVVSEGHLAKDPEKIRSNAAMKDQDKTLCLAWAWAVTGDKRYAGQCRNFLLAWARTNQPDGNAINETKFEPMIMAYDLVRSDCSESDRLVIDDWLRKKAETLQKRRPGLGGNWYSHRLKIVGLIGFTLGDGSLIQTATVGFRKQIATALEPDGSSLGFHRRDAMHYHLYSIEPLLTLARAADRAGEHLFDYRAPNGASLHHSVDFVVPFAEGQKTHIEFANTRNSFDRKRAKNGETEYQPHLWNPKSSIQMFSEAAWFVPEYGALAARLAGKPKEKFLNWHMVINVVSRRPTGAKP